MWAPLFFFKPLPVRRRITSFRNFNYAGPLEATMVDMWCPAYFVSGSENPLYAANLPGYHVHFISRDRTKGGHLYETEVLGGAILVINL